MKRHLVIALLLSSFAVAATGQVTYAEAWEQGKSDLLNPEYSGWGISQMRPAFARFWGPASLKCSAGTGRIGNQGMGLVFAIDRSGAVVRVFWREDTSFNKCLEPLIRQQRWPDAPKDELYFGLEAKQ